MARHLIVDGFNVIRRDPELSGIEKANFYGAQTLLVKKLSDYRRGTTHRITIVYDGAKGPNSIRRHTQQTGIRIIYSARGETADEVIQSLIADDVAHRSSYIVITADRELALACRAYRVNVLSPEALLRQSRVGSLPPARSDYWYGKHEEKGWVGHTKKKGNPRRAPKKHRQGRGLW